MFDKPGLADSAVFETERSLDNLPEASQEDRMIRIRSAYPATENRLRLKVELGTRHLKPWSSVPGQNDRGMS